MSAILSVEDLNDFISPGVACIKPVTIKEKNSPLSSEIQIGDSGDPVEVSRDGSTKGLEAAQISLSDCLACSGCITSAESVLISLQSHRELVKSLDTYRDKKVFVASISHQARVSLAHAFDLEIDQVDRRLKHLFAERLGFRFVIGLEIGRGICLEKCLDELKEHQSQQDPIPIICSACPGWTCYVEKTHPHMLQYLSRVRSPQQITGLAVKTLIRRDLDAHFRDIYHVSVMPCFDKKLEAARPDLGGRDHRDVDCVVTTKEIIQLLNEDGLQFKNLSESSLLDQDLCPSHWPYRRQWDSHYGASSSGGFLQHVLAYYGNSDQVQVSKIEGKNSDVVEYRITDSQGAETFRAAQVYGFRNIQNLVRKMKVTSSRAKKSPGTTAMSDPLRYAYIEVMACPGGCINGGGQISPPSTSSTKEWRDQANHTYESLAQLSISRIVADKWARGIWDRNLDQIDLSCEFHAVQTSDSVLAAASKW